MSAGTIKGFADRGFAKQGMVLAGSVGTQFDFPATGDTAIGVSPRRSTCRPSTIPRRLA